MEGRGMIVNRSAVLLIVLSFLLLAAGCLNTTADELVEYINEDMQVYGGLMEDVVSVNESYAEALENGQHEEVLSILAEDLIPSLKKVLEHVESVDLEHEELENLNGILIKSSSIFVDLMTTQEKAFRAFMEMQTAEDFDQAVGIVDKVIDYAEQYETYFYEYVETLELLMEEHNVEWEEEPVDTSHFITERDELEEMFYYDSELFLAALGYDSSMLYDSAAAFADTGDARSTAEDRSEQKQADLHVQLTGGVMQQEDGLIIHGESNLPTNAGLEAAVYHHGDEVSDGHTALTGMDGSFTFEIPDIGLEEEEVEVRVMFRPADQEQDLQQLYGEEGEHMEGDYIYLYARYLSTYAQAVMKTRFVMGGEEEVAFEVPDWDRPDDYGEPEIWMEVEEFTAEDGYYELHVRSNLAEGSRIRAEIEAPGYTEADFWETVHVLPDGSFDIRIKEPDTDTDEVYVKIEFIPDQYNWLYIQELYGTYGENLEGELTVETDRGQKIQYLVPVGEAESR